MLFCGSDVAKALGYTNPRKALHDHCRCVTKRDAWVQTGTKSDGTPAMRLNSTNFIPEGDVYRLITHSKLPAAERFEKWVFDEVLPTIRKTGGYGQQINLEQLTKIIAMTVQATVKATLKSALSPRQLLRMQTISSIRLISRESFRFCLLPLQNAGWRYPPRRTS